MEAHHDRQHTGKVVAAVQGKPLGSTLDQVIGAIHVAGGVLDADDSRHFSQTQDGVVRHVGDGAAGHVVEQHGQINRFGNRTEMTVQAFLGGFVVIRHH